MPNPTPNSQLLASNHKFKIGFLSSHDGSNMQAIIDACREGKLAMQPVVIISNNAASNTLRRAKKEKIPAYHLSKKTHPDPQELDIVIRDTLINHQVDLVVLAGYVKKVATQTIKSFKNRILNIHPALLPKYGGQNMYGLNVHRSVIENQETKTGITIHLVDEKYDHGSILATTEIPVHPEDTAETLQKKVLGREHSFYVDILAKIRKLPLRKDDLCR